MRQFLHNMTNRRKSESPGALVLQAHSDADKVRAKVEQQPLVAHVSENASLYGAAIDLKEITRHEHAFPILKQHERIIYAFGQRDGKIFEDMALVGQSEEVAREMNKILEGATAFVKLWASGGKHLTGLADATEITREGKTVTASWQADPETVLAALKEFKQQAHQNHGQHEQHEQ
jgi:hypothetical protein